MHIDVISLFPEMFDAIANQGIASRAIARGLWSLHRWNPRDFTDDGYRRVDDRPYGGGPGMVMLGQPLADAIGAARDRQVLAGAGPTHVIYLSAQGAPLSQARIRELAGRPSLILLAGRYEAVDQRLIDHHVDEEVCVGDFVVSGGELPAMMLMDALVRLLPGAVNDVESVRQDSFAEGLLDCPHYTRPESFEGEPVPEALMSGHHGRIARWRRDRALELTLLRRPWMIERAREEGRLDAADERLLADFANSKKSL